MYNKSMKKFYYTLLFVCFSLPLTAQSLSSALPLLQKQNRTTAQDQQVLQLFRTAKDPNTVFAAGASLVKNPPAKEQEVGLVNLILRPGDPLKSTFAAIIVTAMGSRYEEFVPLFENALQGKDPVLKAYAAGAYSMVTQNPTYANEVVHLYIFDGKFASRAMHFLAEETADQLKLLKTASTHTDPQIRAATAMWLGNLHSQEADKLLLKMAKSETDSSVQAQLAAALALNQSDTLPEVQKGLKKDFQKDVSTTYALAMGFMTGNAIPALRQSLVSKNKNERINTLRALAYMAGVLANEDAFAYSSDRQFDTGLLKSFIPQLNLLARTGDEDERTYAQNTLRQLEKLL